jgi:hypothetical protein
MVQIPPLVVNRNSGSTMEMWLTDHGRGQEIEVWSLRHPIRPPIIFRREPTERFSGIVRYGFEHAGTVPYSQSAKRFHVAAVWLRVHDQLHFRFFLNGQLELREATTLGERKNTSRDPPPLQTMALGQVTSGSPNAPKGLLIHQFRFSGSARYLRTFTPPDELQKNDDTLVLYHFDKDTGEVAVDLSDHHRDGKIIGARFVPAP